MSGLSVPQHLASGALSGLCSSLALQPLDLLKTRLQRGGSGKGLAGIFTIARGVVAQNGVFGLWRGTTPTVARSVPGVAIYFYALQSVRGRLAQIPSLAVPSTGDKGTALPKLSAQANLVSGACTRVAVGFLLSPLAVLKARFESGAFAYTSIPQGLASLVQAHGVRGLWQGFLPSVFRDAPYAGLFVASYEAAKTYGERRFDTSAPGTAAIMHSGAGMFAGAFATFATHPFDMVKTSMQVRSEPQFSRFITTITALWREAGVFGFFNGMSLRMTRKVCSSAIGWSVYEAMLLAFRKREERRVGERAAVGVSA
ncbi:mitochondrial carrier protein [Ceratobasidium sp. AG-Ba]|nr:mitochondrial carrier protein [Ceratobasidium sp. AG-Ba]